MALSHLCPMDSVHKSTWTLLERPDEALDALMGPERTHLTMTRRVKQEGHGSLPPASGSAGRPRLPDAGHPRRLTGTQPRPGSGQPVSGQAEAGQGTRTEVQFPCRAGSNTGLWHINERSGNCVEKNCCTPIDKAQKSLGYSTHPQAWYLTCYLGFLPVW